MEEPFLETRNWIEFKVFMNLGAQEGWRGKLNCYYTILRTLKPVLTDTQMIDFFFFSQYGPKDYHPEPEENYIKRVETPPTFRVSYIRIRLHLVIESVEIIDRLSLNLNGQNAVWDFEILDRYDVRGDLGNRYGRRDDGTIDDEATVNFVKYWDAGCRYILSALNESNDFRDNVDVWGIPHLINNAIGSVLRIQQNCQNCNSRLWLITYPIEITQEININVLPHFLAICENCGTMIPIISNI